MTPFFEYILKVNGLLLLVFGFYLLFLKKETFFTAIRYYFLIGIGCSLVLPLLTFTKIVYVEQTMDLSMLINQYTVDESSALEQSLLEQWGISGILTFLFVLITTGIGLFFIFKIRRLISYIKKLKCFSSADSALKVDDNSQEAYSFWKWIVLPVNHQKIEALDMIIQHEKIHVEDKHTLDLLLIQFLRRVFWFNPLLVALEKAIRLNLEYIVDQKVITLKNSYAYQIALVHYKQAKNTELTLVNSFGASDLKKRILMLNQPKSNHMKKSKLALCLPIAVGFFLLFQVKTQAEVQLIDQEINTVNKEQEPEKRKETSSGALMTKEGELVKQEQNNSTSVLPYSYTLDSENLSEETLKETVGLKWDMENANRDREDAKRDMENANRDREDAKRDMENANRDREDAKRDMENAKRDMENANRDREDAKRDMENAKRDWEDVKRDMENAKRDMENAKRDMENAKNGVISINTKEK